jgi:hypothetical protein
VKNFGAHVGKCRVDCDAESGSGLELEVVDLEGLRGLQVQLRDADGHQAPEVLQGLDEADVDVGVGGDAALQVVGELEAIL